MKKTISVFLMFVVIAGCEPEFWAVCDESHPSVAHARSLTAAQLTLLYAEMFRLREQNAGSLKEYGPNPHLGDAIPRSISFLEADRVRPNHVFRPNIMLAGCMDEFIYLDFYGPETNRPRIELSWVGSPHAKVSEVLWEAKK